MDYEHEVEAWVTKLNTVAEVRWALVFTNACINSLTVPNGIDDPYELAVWRARLSLLRTKALLMGFTFED